MKIIVKIGKKYDTPWIDLLLVPAYFAAIPGIGVFLFCAGDSIISLISGDDISTVELACSPFIIGLYVFAVAHIAILYYFLFPSRIDVQPEELSVPILAAWWLLPVLLSLIV